MEHFLLANCRHVDLMLNVVVDDGTGVTVVVDGDFSDEVDRVFLWETGILWHCHLRKRTKFYEGQMLQTHPRWRNFYLHSKPFVVVVSQDSSIDVNGVAGVRGEMDDYAMSAWKTRTQGDY